MDYLDLQFSVGPGIVPDAGHECKRGFDAAEGGLFCLHHDRELMKFKRYCKAFFSYSPVFRSIR